MITKSELQAIVDGLTPAIKEHLEREITKATTPLVELIAMLETQCRSLEQRLAATEARAKALEEVLTGPGIA